MTLIGALILVPLAVAFLLLFVRNDTARALLVVATLALLAVLAVITALQYLLAPSNFVLPQAELVSYAALFASVLCCFYIVWRGIRAGNYLAIFLAGLQLVLVLFYELGMAHDAVITADVYLDQLSIIMALVIAIVGGLICVYALGYMRDYQEHLELEGSRLAVSGDPSRIAEALKLVRDRRPVFFAVIFLFLSAMFALVFSNRLSWMLVAWEVTTVCSFVLIGYSKTKEATKNSFKALNINLAGALAFSLALIMLAGEGFKIFELDQLVAAGIGGALILPLMLLAFAGMTKAAQMPFQGWLLGAMVAPTPVSALLHSATMVKAGVFLLIRLAPTFGWNLPGLFVIIVGGLTFLICSALAISQSNAKRVLAYSTVANLGLITCCVGVGTPEATWAAIFLLIFHAGAKALLFCSVGTAEHHLGSRDIEAMDNIFVRMPWIASLLALGMMAMFIAPFGMLISKWAALVSIAESGHFELLFILAFGSALTFVVWAKWLGKVLSLAQGQKPVSSRVSPFEKITLALMAFTLLVLTLGLPYISEWGVVPYLRETGMILQLLPWITASDVLGYDNLAIMSIILMVLMVLFAVQLLRRRPAINDTVYMAGVGQDSNKRTYSNAFGETTAATQRNWYMEQIFGEEALGKRATVLVGATLVLFFIFGFIAQALVML